MMLRLVSMKSGWLALQLSSSPALLGALEISPVGSFLSWRWDRIFLFRLLVLFQFTFSLSLIFLRERRVAFMYIISARDEAMMLGLAPSHLGLLSECARRGLEPLLPQDPWSTRSVD